MFIRSLLIALFALIAQQTTPARASDQSAVRMITTHTTESAPLNLLGRAFLRLEPAFADHIEARRLTYLARPRGTGADSMLDGVRQLLANISAANSAVNITTADSESQARAQSDAFLQNVTQSLEPSRAAAAVDVSERLKLALNSAITRQDMKVFAATVAEENLNSSYLILLDEETSDLLLLSISRPSN